MIHVARIGLAVALCASLVGGCGKTARLDTASGLAISSPGGSVDVTVAGTAPVRAVRSVIADVAFYRVTLSGGSLKSPEVKQCAAPANSNGKVSVRFDNLAAGTYSMKVEALDATGTVLGSDTEPGTVTPGQCTYIDLHVKLADTVVDNPQGSLGARITVTEGGTVTRPIADCPSTDGFVPLDGSACPPIPTPPASGAASPAR